MASRTSTTVQAAAPGAEAPTTAPPGAAATRSWSTIPAPRLSAEQKPAAQGLTARPPRPTAAGAAGVALVVLTVASLFLDAQQAQPLVVLVGAAAALTLLRAPGSRLRVSGIRFRLLRHPVRLIGAGIGVLTITEAVRPMGAAFPTTADTLTFVSYPFVLAGLLCLTRARVREATLDTLLVAAIVPVSLGAATWLPLMEAGWAQGLSSGTWAVAALLGVDLLAVTIIVRLAALFRGSALAYQLLVGAFACVLATHVARALAAVTDVVPAPFGSQTLLVLGFGLAAIATLHPSLPRAVDGSVLARAPLSPLHLALLLAAVAAGPVVLLLHQGPREQWVLLAVGSPALVSLLVVAHLARLLRERVGLEYASTHDPLTSLPHRARFHELLALALARDETRQDGIAVMFIDLDDFKNVNDRLGHAAGDELLRQVADRLRGSTRRGDVVARLGGDEFGVLLQSGTDRSEAQAAGERVLAAVGASIQLTSGSVDVTPSVGIALAPEHGTDADELVRNADSAMYRAKKAGRNRVQIYDEGIGEQVRARLGVQSRLRTAIDQQEMVLHYQPKVDLSSGDVAGVEALVRWHHPSLGLIGPGGFISQAERSGLIAPLGQWVMRTACTQAQQWRNQGLGDLPVSVNISPRQFDLQDVAQMVRTALDDSGLPPHLLEIELTESVSLGDGDAAAAVRSLGDLGVLCSIDDFGTGYSSISYLHDYRVDTIKIDRSFVAGISRNDRDAPIVRAVIAMAHNLGIRVVAEGVETVEQTEFLRRHGCDQVQGYLFGRPGPEHALRELMRGVSACAPLSERPASWDERELGQRLWREEQHLLDEHPAVVLDVTDTAAVRAAGQRGFLFLTAASGVVVPLMLGVGAGKALPAQMQVALESALHEAGISAPRAVEQGDRTSRLLHVLGLSRDEQQDASKRPAAARPTRVLAAAPPAAVAPGAAAPATDAAPAAHAAVPAATPGEVDPQPILLPGLGEEPVAVPPQYPVVQAPPAAPPATGGMPHRNEVPAGGPAAPERRPSAPAAGEAPPTRVQPPTTVQPPQPERAPSPSHPTSPPQGTRPVAEPPRAAPATAEAPTPAPVPDPMPTRTTPSAPAQPSPAADRPDTAADRPEAAPESSRAATPRAVVPQPDADDRPSTAASPSRAPEAPEAPGPTSPESPGPAKQSGRS